MKLSIRSFSELVQDMSATLQGSATKLVDVSVGSVLRAVLEANAAVAIWIQFLVTQLLRATRAATSEGVDLDSWMQDFGLIRLPATAATGSVVFSRYSTSARAILPEGARVKTLDGSIGFVVEADPGHGKWSPSERAYVFSPGVEHITVPVRAEQPGPSGNVQEGMIGLIASTLASVDTVTNPDALMGGMDAESDDALRDRFQGFINSRSRATVEAIRYAILSVQPGLCHVIEENSDAAGNYRLGSFLVVLDDGSGHPPTTLLAAVSQAVDQIRPVGTYFVVQPPDLTYADVSIDISTEPGASLADVRVPLLEAIRRYISQLEIGTKLSLSRLAQVVYQADPRVTDVSNVRINGSAQDLLVGRRTAVKPGVVAIT